MPLRDARSFAGRRSLHGALIVLALCACGGDKVSTLTVRLDGRGSGRVRGTGITNLGTSIQLAAIDCPPRCTTSLPWAEPSGLRPIPPAVDLEAIADLGSVFVRWDGVASSEASLRLALDRDMTLTAIFEPTPVGDLFAIWGSSAADVWAVGERGVILHWDGASWSKARTAAASRLSDVWGSATDDVWGVGDQIVHWDGHAWSQWSSGIDPAQGCAVWGSSSGDVWLLPGWNNTTAEHWDGSRWSAVSFAVDPSVALGIPCSLRGRSADDIWGVAHVGYVIHWDGAAWRAISTGTTQELAAAWPSGPDDVWAVGDNLTIIHWNGTAWSNERPVGLPPNPLASIWGFSESDLWAVGQFGTTLHWDGAAWSSIPSPTTNRLDAVWGASSRDVWAAGQDGVIIHWDGNAWEAVMLALEQVQP